MSTADAKVKKLKLKIKRPDSLALKGRFSRFIGALFKYSLVMIIAFLILFPFISKISSSFMSIKDMYDRTVNLIPKQPNLEMYSYVITSIGYFPTMFRTLGLSLLCAVPQTFICAFTGYALSKLRTKVGKLTMVIVILTILVPPQILLVPLYLKFRFFDIFGIIELLTGNSVNLINRANGILPFLILSLTGFGFKNGIYIFLMRQFYKGVPEELEEAAYIDGCGTLKTYLRIMIPLSIPMFVTIFIFSFAWQWTDTFYTGLFMSPSSVLAGSSLTVRPAADVGIGAYYGSALMGTAVILAILPIVIVYLFAQKKIIAGIERSGIVG